MSRASETDLATLQRVSLFAGLRREALLDLYEQADVRRFPASHMVFRQEDPARVLYVVRSGRIRVSEVTVEGEEVLLRFLEPGYMLGGMAALEGMTYPVNAEAVVDSSALAWSHQTIDRMIDRYPQLARNAMRLMVGRIRELQQRTVELATERVEQRIARTLLRLAEQTGKRTAEGVLLDMQLSRQDLAAMTGTTLFTVSRTLNRWSEQGFLTLGRQRVTLKQPHALVSIADNLPE